MKRNILLLGIVLVFIVSGCSSMKESTKTKTHKYMEHAGIDWFDF